MCSWGLPKQDRRFVESWLLHSGRHKEMQASTCGLVPHNSATSASVIAARLMEKFLSFLVFSQCQVGRPREGSGAQPLCKPEQYKWQTLFFPVFLFLFCLPGRFKKNKKKQKNHFTFYFQAHPVPSQGKKATEQQLFIKSLFNCPCLVLAGFS